MNLLLLISVLILTAAFTWTVHIIVSQKEWRFSFASVMILFMIGLRFASADFEIGKGITLTIHMQDFLVLLLSFFVLLAIIYFENILKDQKKTASAVLYNEQRLRSVVDTALDGIIVIDEHGIVESFNRGAQNIFGYQAEEILGRNIKMIMPSPIADEHDSYIEKYIRSGKSSIIGLGREVRGLRKDGTVVPLQISIGEFYQNEKRYFTGFLHSLEDLQKMQSDLWEEKNLVTTILDTAGALIVVTDKDGRIMRFNKSCEQLTGYSLHEVKGHRPREFLIAPENVETTVNLLRTLLEGGQSLKLENQWVTKSGERRTIAWNITSIVDAQNKLQRISAGIDITEAKKAEEEIQFLAHRIIQIQEEERNNISREIHDSLGQSLIALKFLVENLLLNVLPEKKLKTESNQIINYINKVINDARIISHTLSPIALKKIGLSHAIRELAGSLQLTETVVRLDIEALDDFFPEKWDINVYRIVQEALANIQKHAGATRIDIIAVKKNDGLKLCIKDNGQGIKFAGLQKDRASGMGLLTMRERARLIGGELKIISEPEKGTEIVLEIQRN